MEVKPDLRKLMRREIYTFLTITLFIVLGMLIIHGLVVWLDDEVTNTEFTVSVWPWVIGFLVFFWMVVPWIQYLWIINLAYSIQDERVVINKGIIFKKNVSIPYSAITDFTLSRSLYERWLGIGTLLIQTAGQGAQAGGHEGRLEGLVAFEDIHRSLREKVKTFRGGQGLSETDARDVTPKDDRVLESILEEIKKINRKLN